MPAPCEPKLSPLRDNDDFILLRCDTNCFHLVLPFLSIHFTACELRTALDALRGLWAGRSAVSRAAIRTFCFRRFGAPAATVTWSATER